MNGSASHARAERATRDVGGLLVGRVGQWSIADFQDGWHAARYLLRLAEADAKKSEVIALAKDMRARVGFTQDAGADDEAFARVLQQFGQRVVFHPEEGEAFQSIAETVRTGGDCDDHARMLYALGKAAGLPVAMALLFTRDEKGRPHDPEHVLVAWMSKAGAVPLETTCVADFGEDPVDAASRLGLLRDDLRGAEVFFMVPGQFDSDPAVEVVHEAGEGGASQPEESGASMGSIGDNGFVPVSGVDDAFWPAVVGMFGDQALSVLAVMLNESGLHPTAANPFGVGEGALERVREGGHANAVGINQLSTRGVSGTFDEFGEDRSTFKGLLQPKGITIADYLSLSASEQLKVGAGPYFLGERRNHPEAFNDVRDIYWLNLAPATYESGKSDSDVAIPSDKVSDRVNESIIAGNPSFVTDGVILAGSLRSAAEAATRSQPQRWAAIVENVRRAGGGTTLGGGGGGFVTKAIGIGAAGAALLAWWHFFPDSFFAVLGKAKGAAREAGDVARGLLPERGFLKRRLAR